MDENQTMDEFGSITPEKKKMGKGKKLLIILAGLILVMLAATGVLFLNKNLQMKLMTNYVMKNLSGYQWSALKMEDPVTPALQDAFGEDHKKSVDTLYGYLKDSAGKMTWKMVEADPEQMTAKVEVEYVDGSSFMTEYGNGMGDYIVKSIDENTMTVSDIMNVLTIISDEDNSALLTEARKNSEEKTDMKKATLTINFSKKYGLFIPKGTSDEVLDVATAGLSSSLEDIQDVVAARMIPQIVDRVFGIIQTFDETEIKKYTGKSIEDLTGMNTDNVLYKVIYNYLKSCGAEMEYTVGDYDQSTGAIEVECSFLDSKNVVSQYLKNLAYYAITHLKSPVPGEEDNAALLQETAESADKERIQKTVTITFDPENYSKFQVSDEIYDVVTANLNSEIQSIAQYLGN